MNPLHGKTALVTGSSRGIGAAIARRLAADGARIAVHYVRSRDAAEALAAELGNGSFTVGGDVATDGAAIVAATIAEAGRLDILVNNAGVYAPDSDARQLYAVNVVGLLEVTLAALPHLGEDARIVNVSSVLGRHPAPGTAAYSGTKAAVEAITVAHARELGARGIRVNAVAPGLTETDMSAMNPPEAIAAMVGMTPLGRIGRPEEIADAVAFLAGPGGAWITGETLAVSGGIRP